MKKKVVLIIVLVIGLNIILAVAQTATGKVDHYAGHEIGYTTSWEKGN